MPFELGSLVYIRSMRKVGRITQILGNHITIEVFYSVAKQELIPTKAEDLLLIKLKSGTRCYRRNGENWSMGRTGNIDPNDGQLEFKGADGWGYFPPQEIYVRTPGAREDPLEVLIQCGNDTPFFSDRRSRLLAEFVEQRTSCQGLTGVLSSCIEHYSHQIEAAARILSDPVQRYLLADEVGLGKTMEAGMVLRQYLIDEPNSSALILVPMHLIDQWNSELEVKFKVSDFPYRVQVVAHGEKIVHSTAKLLIIDEAHQVAKGAFSTDELSKQHYQSIAELARTTQKVLLLSATPILDHQDDYLAMLHLLEPNTYKLEDIDAFRKKLEGRESIGKTLLVLTPDVDPYPLSRATARLCELCPNDLRLHQLCAGIETLPEDARVSRIRAIRTHVSEVHRIYRRMIRNRKAHTADVVGARILPTTDYKRSYSMIAEFDIDDDAKNLDDAIEGWRSEAVQYCGESSGARKLFASIYGSLVECNAVGSIAMLEFVAARTRKSTSDSIRCLLGNDRIAQICKTPHFSGEQELLDRMKTFCEYVNTTTARSQLAVEVAINMSNQRRRENLPTKVVIFCGFAPLAELVAAALNIKKRQHIPLVLATTQRPQITTEIDRFRNDPNCDFLICDSTAEEGFNLQCASSVLLMDLPFSPRRIEQRLGRLDRIGQNDKLLLKLLVGLENGPTYAWAYALAVGFCLFNRSIASMQLAAENEAIRLLGLMFDHGPRILLEDTQIKHVNAALERELQRTEEHDVLDAQDAHTHSDLTEAIFKRTETEQVESASTATETWICEGLRGDKVQITDRNVKYTFNHSLIPKDVAQRWSQCFTNPHTYSRSVANKTPFPRLMRLGNPFIDLLHHNLLEDDRGQASAMWRYVRAWSNDQKPDWIGFKFQYLIEGDSRVAVAANNASPSATERLLDGCFTPLLKTIYVHATNDITPDSTVVKELIRPYEKHSEGGTDVNLAGDLKSEFLERFEIGDWKTVCLNAKSRAENIIRESVWFRDSLQTNLIRTQKRFNDNLGILQARNQHSMDEINIAVEQAFADSIIHAVEHPTLTLDAVTFYILTGQERRRDDGLE